ncbi:MAG: trypsin-like peptidase domain-containing protein, partial [Planctomycetaceae bacterium]|nr:trypsin-like peptidase domain-containing protein [Planctomycetaceae bacterium]
MNSERPHSANLWLVGILLLLSGALTWQILSTAFRPTPAGNYVPRAVTPRGELGADESATIEIFRQTSPSVVFIQTKGFRPTYFGGGIEEELSSGTGFVWDERGYIVTNLHVVREALSRGANATLEVKFPGDIVTDAEVVGGVFENDIAVLKVAADAVPLQPILLGTSADLEVGQKVLAIGNPFGFDQTLSTGVIGGLNRTVGTGQQGEALSGLIQTDAAINPGNSGGPLLDSAGRLIGVNTAIVSPTGAYSGLGFAVPVDAVLDSVPRVVEEASGKQRPELLGASVLNRESALQLGIPQEIIDRGLIVGRVLHNSAAFDAGLMPGDQITAVDGKVLSAPPR